MREEMVMEAQYMGTMETKFPVTINPSFKTLQLELKRIEFSVFANREENVIQVQS